MTAVPSKQPHIAAAARPALRAMSTPGSSISTIRSIRTIRGSGRRSTTASRSTSRTCSASTVCRPAPCRNTSITSTARRCAALIDEYGIDPYDFLDFAHDIDHTDIELERGARRGDRAAAGAQADPHQRLAQARRERCPQDRHPRPFRGRLRHRCVGFRAEARPARLRALPRRHGVEPAVPRCSRTSRRTSSCRTISA